jgi:copper chaperone CopZ
MATTVLKVKGMTCDHCVRTVKQALESVDGVEDAKVDLRASQATVEYRDGATTPRALANAVMDEGYMAEEAA